MLIRDAAYRSLPKETRAELHERFAGLARGHGRRRGLREFEEIVGYHLEQAYRFLAELGHADARADSARGTRGASGSSRPGAARCARSDRAGAVGLLERAAPLVPERRHAPGARCCPSSAPR